MDRRQFTLQLYDRIEPIPDQSPTNPPQSSELPDHVRSMLRGHPLECPQCGCEPRATRLDVDDNTSPVYGGMGVAGVIVGPTTQTLEADCTGCSLEITYDVHPDDGRPSAKAWTRIFR